jgi:hypothetical protein
MTVWLLEPAAPIVFGVLAGLLAYVVRHYCLGRPRTVNYFVIFMNSASCYVFLVMLYNHKINGVAYAAMLETGFGIDEVTFAFLFAAYHLIVEIGQKVWRID